MRAKLSLKGRALQWLAQREQSRLELRRKLLRAVAESRRRAAATAAGAADAGAAADESGAHAHPSAHARAHAHAYAHAHPRAHADATADIGATADLDAAAAAAADVDVDVDSGVAVGPAADDSACDDGHGEVESLLDWLEANGYLSNERFVESRVHARRARFGNLRIESELAQHGAALPPAVRQALAESEPARASCVLARRFASYSGDAAERARQARFLAARGFSAEVIRRVLRELGRSSAAAPVE